VWPALKKKKTRLDSKNRIGGMGKGHKKSSDPERAMRTTYCVPLKISRGGGKPWELPLTGELGARGKEKG